MPGPTIDQAFITKFNRDTHLAYQRTGSVFRSLVRTDPDVEGEKVRFQKLGTMSVSSKARNGDIPIQNPEHTWVEVSLLDRYGAVLIDKLDLTKLNTPVREGYVFNMQEAFGRETDDQIIDAMEAGATQTVGTYATSMTANIALQARKALDIVSVPSDSRVYCAVTPHAWMHLMKVREFSEADFIGHDNMPWKNMGLEMKRWNRVNWFQFGGDTGLPGQETSQAKCYMWHWRSMGHAIGAEVDITWAWENLKKGWSGAGSMSMNAVVIDPRGLVEIRLDDTYPLAA